MSKSLPPHRLLHFFPIFTATLSRLIGLGLSYLQHFRTTSAPVSRVIFWPCPRYAFDMEGDHPV